jgi:hypothetical protein
MTGHCLFGRHSRCPYRAGGQCAGGINLIGGVRYMCPCECHTENTGQLDLFDEAGVR